MNVDEYLIFEKRSIRHKMCRDERFQQSVSEKERIKIRVKWRVLRIDINKNLL